MQLIQDRLDLPVFTANLQPNNQDGSLEFGYIDHTLYHGALVSAPINNTTDSSWTVDNVVMVINGIRVVQSMLVGIRFPFLFPPFRFSFFSAYVQSPHIDSPKQIQ